jgi:predicted transposase/invertase (TIGR01784 family)
MITDDATHKHLYSSPEFVRDLVCTFSPHPWLLGLDYTTLEKVAASFVTDSMRQRHSDTIWRLQVQGQWIYLYLLIEFQSRIDPHMSVRTMTYIGLLYQDLITQHQVLVHDMLPPVLPIVLYNGAAPWSAAIDISDLIPSLPDELARYTPSLSYVLIDEGRSQPPEGTHNLLTHLMRFAQSQDARAQQEHLENALKLVQNDSKMVERINHWVDAVLVQRGFPMQDMPLSIQQGDFVMHYKFGFEKWAEDMQGVWLRQGIEKGIEQGIEQGISQGESLLFQKMLTRRFGPIPNGMVQKINKANRQDIEAWGERVLVAPTLQAVFHGR